MNTKIGITPHKNLKKLNRIKDYQFKSIIFLKESFLVVGSNGCGEAI